MKEEIKPTDLMIGNYVRDIHSEYGFFKVLELRKDIVKYGNLFKAKYDDLRPIPLTEDILLKCGFEKHRKGYSLNVGGESFDYYINGKFVIWYHKYKGYSLDTISKSGDVFYNSLHQLQNLFKVLVGNDLNVNV